MDESSVVEQRTQSLLAAEAEAVNLCNANRRDPLVSGSNPLGGAILLFRSEIARPPGEQEIRIPE
jgi:hypothetical protein